MYVVILAIEFHQFRLKVLAYGGHHLAQVVQNILGEHPTTVLGDKDQVNVKIKYAVSSGSNFAFLVHTPMVS